MPATIIPKETDPHGAVPANAFDRLARRLFFQLIEQLETGRIVLVDGEETFTFGATTPDFPLTSNTGAEMKAAGAYPDGA